MFSRAILLLAIVFTMVAGAIYGVILIPKNEVLLSTTITLTKLDSGTAIKSVTLVEKELLKKTIDRLQMISLGT